MKQDIDYTRDIVPQDKRKGLLAMFMIMLGFTFFSASMWTGQKLAMGTDLCGFLQALLYGGLILSAYTGMLGYIGAKSGMTLDMLSRRSFGRKGSWLPSGMIALTQTGCFGVGIAMFAIPVVTQILHIEVSADNMPWEGYAIVVVAGLLMTATAYFGIKCLALISYIAVPSVALLGTIAMVMAVSQGDGTLVSQFAHGTKDITLFSGIGLVTGSFISGGTSTPNFTRFARTKWQGLWVTVVAFFIGNSLMFFFGAISSIYVGGNDIFEVMINIGLFYAALIVLGLNIWTTNDNAIYTSGLGLANIFGMPKHTMVLVAGTAGTLLAVWLYWNFCDWLNILNCTLPPLGMILILDYFIGKGDKPEVTVRWSSVIGVVMGATIANIITWGIASINGMAVAAVCYLSNKYIEKTRKVIS